MNDKLREIFLWILLVLTLGTLVVGVYKVFVLKGNFNLIDLIYIFLLISLLFQFIKFIKENRRIEEEMEKNRKEIISPEELELKIIERVIDEIKFLKDEVMILRNEIRTLKEKILENDENKEN